MIRYSLPLVLLLLITGAKPTSGQQAPTPIPPPAWPVNTAAVQGLTNHPLAQTFPHVAPAFQDGQTSAGASADPNTGEKTVSQRVDELERELQKMKDAEKKKKKEDAKKPSIKVRGRIQADAAWFSQDAISRTAVGDIQDGADFRRARLGAQGAAFEVTEYVFEMDFARGNVVFTDVYLQATELPILGAVRAGHYFEPFSLEQVTSDNYTMFLERSLPFALSTERNWGLASYNHNEAETLTWGYGAFKTGSNGSGDDVGDNGEWSFTSRTTWLVNGARMVQRVSDSRRSAEKCSAHGLSRGFVTKTCDGKSVTSPTNREKHECTKTCISGPKFVAWC